LAEVSQIAISKDTFNKILAIVLNNYHELGGDDLVAKGRGLTPAILNDIEL